MTHDTVTIHTVLNKKINDFITIEKQNPKIIIISDLYLINLRKIDKDINYTEYRNIKVISTVKRNILEVY